MTKRLALALALSFGLIGTACAQLIPQAGSDVKAATSGVYALDKSHANVVFTVKHLGYSNYIGRFNTMEGSLNFDPAAVEKSVVNVTINPASVDTNNTKLQDELKTDKYFNVAKFPAITFKSTSATKTGEKTGTVTGDLTFMGVTKPITLNTTFNGAGIFPMSGKPTIGFSATGTLKRSEFGLTALVPAVSDDVQLIIEAEFNKN